jgi:hypothetical protein
MSNYLLNHHKIFHYSVAHVIHFSFRSKFPSYSCELKIKGLL